MKNQSIQISLIICFLLFLIVGCSQSGRRKSHTKVPSRTQSGSTHKDNNFNSKNNSSKNEWHGKTTVRMKKKNGVYEIPIKINGTRMFFIFDTGAGMVSISETEAMFLAKQGTLSKDDIISTANFTDANGDISEGTIINLKTVQIGDRTLHNIRASVVHNLKAPLLLGQSVLEKFGKVSIDYQNDKIILQ